MYKTLDGRESKSKRPDSDSILQERDESAKRPRAQSQCCNATEDNNEIMANEQSHDAYSQQQPRRKQDSQNTESERSEKEAVTTFDDKIFTAEVRAGSSLHLFRQYLQWFTKHTVGEKPEQQPELPEEAQEINAAIEAEDTVTVEAFGKGKTGFIDVPEAPEDAPILDLTIAEEEVAAASPQTYSFPDTDNRDYKEGKSTKPKTMQDLLLASTQK